MSLMEKLAGDLGALHFAQIEGLNAQAQRIATADEIAQRLQSAGIEAHAEGHIRRDGTAGVWVRAAAEVPRLRDALTRLNIAEDPSAEPLTNHEIHIAGDVPIYAFTPIAHPSTVE